jgi:hypothetical protein
MSQTKHHHLHWQNVVVEKEIKQIEKKLKEIKLEEIKQKYLTTRPHLDNRLFDGAFFKLFLYWSKEPPHF